MAEITFKGEALTVSPLTVLSEAKRNSLYLRLLETLKTGDETQQYFAEYRRDAVYVYATCVVMLTASPFGLPPAGEPLATHAVNFLVWCDRFATVAEINTLYKTIDALNKPGDERTAPPETLTGEKKAS